LTPYEPVSTPAGLTLIDWVRSAGADTCTGGAGAGACSARAAPAKARVDTAARADTKRAADMVGDLLAMDPDHFKRRAGANCAKAGAGGSE
jgi:hypothetical protein